MTSSAIERSDLSAERDFCSEEEECYEPVLLMEDNVCYRSKIGANRLQYSRGNEVR